MKKSLAAALLFASSAFAAAAPHVTGKWNIHQNVAGNEADSECNLVQTESTIGGNCKSPEGKDLPVKGALEATKGSWQFNTVWS